MRHGPVLKLPLRCMPLTRCPAVYETPEEQLPAAQALQDSSHLLSSSSSQKEFCRQLSKHYPELVRPHAHPHSVFVPSR